MTGLKAFLAVTITAAALLTVSCGETRAPLQPVYRFELEKPVAYRLQVKFDLSLDMGLAKYNGLVDFSADVEFKAVEADSNGWKIILDIRNPDIRGADSRINTAIYYGLNMARNWFSTFRMDRYGKLAVFYEGNPQYSLTTFMAAVFPDFTDMVALAQGAVHTTNFGAKMQNLDLTMIFGRTETIRVTTASALEMDEVLNVKTFDKNEFEKSVEPVPMGRFNMDLVQGFDLLNGRLASKKGKMDLFMKFPLKQGILSYNILIQGSGTLDLTLKENGI